MDRQPASACLTADKRRTLQPRSHARGRQYDWPGRKKGIQTNALCLISSYWLINTCGNGSDGGDDGSTPDALPVRGGEFEVITVLSLIVEYRPSGQKSLLETCLQGGAQCTAVVGKNSMLDFAARPL